MWWSDHGKTCWIQVKWYYNWLCYKIQDNHMICMTTKCHNNDTNWSNNIQVDQVLCRNDFNKQLSINGGFTPILFSSMALSKTWLNFVFTCAWAYRSAQHRWAHNMIWNYASGKLIFHTISNTLWNVIDFQQAIFMSVISRKKTFHKWLNGEKKAFNG